MLGHARNSLRGIRFPRTNGVRYTSSTPRIAGRRLALVSGGALSLGLATILASKTYADSATVVAFPATSRSKRDDPGATQSSFGTLVRTYVVYTMCSIPALVDNAPWLLETFSSIPGLRWITEAIVRVTFFDQVWDCALEIFIGLTLCYVVCWRRYGSRNAAAASRPANS
jgi:proline dehydrogenase